MALKAGSLSERIRIERLVDPADAAGGQDEAWELVRTVWAGVRPMAGDEVTEEGALRPLQGWRVELRFAGDLVGETLRFRFAWNGLILNPRTAEDPDGRRERLVVFCEGREA